jgi:hypothetical protein
MFCFPFNDLQITVILLKIDHKFLVLDRVIGNRVIGRSEYGDVNMGADTVYVEVWLA